MFDRKKYEIKLEVAAAKTHGLWAARLETKDTQPTRMAGQVVRPEDSPASRHALLATAIMAALGSITKRNHVALTEIANRQGAKMPRLQLRVQEEFVAGLRGEGEAPFKVSRNMRRALLRYLEIFEVDFDPVIATNDERDPGQQALYSFGMRTLINPQTDYEHHPAPHFVPQAISILDERIPFPAPPAPITPKYVEGANAQ